MDGRSKIDEITRQTRERLAAIRAAIEEADREATIPPQYNEEEDVFGGDIGGINLVPPLTPTLAQEQGRQMQSPLQPTLVRGPSRPLPPGVGSYNVDYGTVAELDPYVPKGIATSTYPQTPLVYGRTHPGLPRGHRPPPLTFEEKERVWAEELADPDGGWLDVPQEVPQWVRGGDAPAYEPQWPRDYYQTGGPLPEPWYTPVEYEEISQLDPYQKIQLYEEVLEILEESKTQIQEAIRRIK